MAKKILYNEWLKELDSLGILGNLGDKDLKTAKELCEYSGFSIKKVYNLLNLAKKKGFLVVGEKVISDLSNRQQKVKAYKLMKK